MTVYVGSARSDENGKANSGKAGDQKQGKEVSTQAWYRDAKGWRVFRAVDPAVALKIGQCMEEACANDNIGYDQWQRHTLYAQAEKVGFDVKKVKTACETDCSALVRVCLAFAGIMGIPEEFRTGNMPDYLLKTGAFVELKESKYTTGAEWLGYGDILVTKTSGHTVVVISDGKYYTRELPEGSLKVKSGSWNIRTGPGTQYPVAAVVHGGDVLAEADTEGWTAIEHNDRLLWISNKALEG